MCCGVWLAVFGMKDSDMVFVEVTSEDAVRG